MKPQFDLASLVRKNILSLKPYSSARDEFSGSEGIFLDANENPFGTYNRYPDPRQKALKKALSELKDMPQEQIFIGNGSDEVIDLIFRVFGNPGNRQCHHLPAHLRHVRSVGKHQRHTGYPYPPSR